MLYSLDRSTPEEKLVKVEHDELVKIGRRIEAVSYTHLTLPTT